MTKEEKHKWNHKTDICVKCGLKRIATHVGRWKYYTYERSGIAFAKRPECIDWNKENAKTID